MARSYYSYMIAWAKRRKASPKSIQALNGSAAPTCTAVLVPSICPSGRKMHIYSIFLQTEGIATISLPSLRALHRVSKPFFTASGTLPQLGRCDDALVRLVCFALACPARLAVIDFLLVCH